MSNDGEGTNERHLLREAIDGRDGRRIISMAWRLARGEAYTLRSVGLEMIDMYTTPSKHELEC